MSSRNILGRDYVDIYISASLGRSVFLVIQVDNDFLNISVVLQEKIDEPKTMPSQNKLIPSLCGRKSKIEANQGQARRVAVSNR
jgi:hypothetical protein